MAISIGPKVSQSVPDGGGLPPQPDDAAQVANKQTNLKGEVKLGQGRELAKQDAQLQAKPTAHKDGKALVGEGALHAGAPLLLDAAAFADLLVKADGKELLGVLTKVVNVEQPKEVKGTTALEAFQTCKPLLGKPTGQAVGEQFDHPELKALAAIPEALSEGALRTLVSLSSQVSAEPSPQQQPLAESVAVTTRSRGMDEAGLRGKAIIAQFRKMQALSETFLTKMTEQTLPPNAPAAIAKQLLLAAPQIAAVTKQLMKSIEAGAAKRLGKDTDIEIPSAEVVALEKALMPTTEKWISLVAKLQVVAASPHEVASLKEGLRLATELTAVDVGAKLEAVKAHKHYELIAQLIPQAVFATNQGGSSGGGAQGSGSAQSSVVGGTGSSGESSMSGFNVDTADIEACIYYIMMQSAKTETDMLRDQMKEMQASNAKKKALREKTTHMKEEQVQIDKALKEEFDFLVANGAIAKDASFDEFKAWRQVTWTPEGDAALAQPMPDLPDSLIFGPLGPDAGPEVPPATGQEPYPCDPELAAELAARFGVSPQDIAYLFSYFQFIKENGSVELGLSPAEMSDQYGGPRGFVTFLRGQVGFPPTEVVFGEGQQPPPATNQGLVDSFFENVVEKDKSYTITTHSRKETRTGGGGKEGYKDPVTAQSLLDMQNDNDRTALLDIVAAALADPDIKKALEKELGHVPTRAEILAMFRGAQPGMSLAHQYRSQLNDVFRAIYQATKDIKPASTVLAAMLTLKDSYQIPGRLPKDIPTIGGLAGDCGLDPRYVWDGGAQPASASDYENYCDDVAGDNQPFFKKMFEILMTQEPYASDPGIQDIMKEIFDKEGGDTKMASWLDFINWGDAEFDDTMVNQMVKLINRVMAIAAEAKPPMPGVPKIAAMLLAVQEEDGSGEERDDPSISTGQTIFWENIGDRIAEKTKKGPLPGEEGGGGDGDVTVEERSTRKDSQPTADFASGRDAANEAAKEANDARKAAEQAVADARNAAANGNRMLGGGQSLEGEEGAITGSSEDFKLALQKVDDEMMALSDMNELQQTRLQILMDRRAKLLETLSNVMKKMSTTKETLSANQK